MTQWSTTTKHEPESINNGRKYELRDRVSIEQLNNMTENSFYAMHAASDAKEKAEEALSFAQGSGTTVFENGSPVAQFNADKKANVTDLNNFYTKEQVDNLIDNNSSDVDLSNYYTKDETYSKQEIDDAISNVDVDLSAYYTKTQTDNLLENKANKSDIPDISGKADKTELSNYVTTSALNSGLARKADQSDLNNCVKYDDIEDSTGSTSTRKVLSANQGRILNNYIQQMWAKLPDEYIKKATVSDNLLILTNQDDENTTFGGGGGSKVIWEVWE